MEGARIVLFENGPELGPMIVTDFATLGHEVRLAADMTTAGHVIEEIESGNAAFDAAAVDGDMGSGNGIEDGRTIVAGLRAAGFTGPVYGFSFDLLGEHGIDVTADTHKSISELLRLIDELPPRPS